MIRAEPILAVNSHVVREMDVVGLGRLHLGDGAPGDVRMISVTTENYPHSEKPSHFFAMGEVR